MPAEYRILYLESSASQNLTRHLKLLLEFNDVLLTEHRSDAQATLTVPPVDIEKRTLSLTGGQINEYELNALLTVKLKRHDRDSFVQLELKGRRTLRNDITRVTGTANMEKELIEQLEADLINKLMRRLQRLNYDNEAIDEAVSEPAHSAS